MDTILFSLLVLRGLCDSQGRMWRCHPNQLYAVEVTMPRKEEADKDMSLPESRTISLMELMPSVFCPSPQIAFDYLEAEKFSKFIFLVVSRVQDQELFWEGVVEQSLKCNSRMCSRVYNV